MLKRIFDCILAFTLLIALSLVLLCVAIVVYFFEGFPLLFKQPRAGLHGKPFILYKFRTMKNNSAQSDADRLTLLGKFLRKTSLDELPQLINVLKGDMSFVGPRPLLLHYLPRYSAEQNRRHAVKPGITGWAQINGRNAVNWEDKFTMDVWYVDHQTFFLDIKIVYMTFWKVIFSKNINSKNTATMTEFMGTKD